MAAEVGTSSTNQKPGTGDLRPWKVPSTVATVPGGRQSIYRFNRDAKSDANYWFSWTTFVTPIRAFLADDTTERTYYAEGGAFKVTDNVIGLAGTPYPTAYRDVGLPAPTTAPTLTETVAGTGDDEERFYIYTFLNDWNEESAPSPPSAVFTCKPGAEIDITTIDTVPGGSHGINRVRIYRTVAGDTGADFFFLREIAAATSSEDDGRTPGSTVLLSGGPPGVLGRQWSVPPSGITNAVAMWNGMVAAISGKSVRVCEPYKPFAWPPAYEILTTDTPVALAVFGKNLLVLTTGTPVLATGSEPLALDGPPLPMVAPCVSLPGVVTFKHGACWPTSEGLAYCDASGRPVNLLANLMRREDWQALNPATIVGSQYAGLYLGFYDSGGGMLKGFMVDPVNPTGIYFLADGYPAAYFDELQATLYVLNGGNVQKWDAGGSTMTVTFRSKVFRLPKPGNPAVAEVIADAYPVTFKLYAGRYGTSGWPAGSLRKTKTVASRRPFKLPAGYLAEEVQIEVSGTQPVTAIAVAGSVADLAQT